MAKKKNRSANIARKRAKRKQEQKSRRKHLATQKHRRFHGERSDEDRLHEMVLQSRQLVNEPEFRTITFDLDLMEARVLEALELDARNQEDAVDGDDFDDDLLYGFTDEIDPVAERFRQEVLPRLLTPEFLHKVTHALSACETRLNRIGQHRKAEIAFVAKSLFEIAEPHVLALHPLILGITSASLDALLNQSEMLTENDQREFVEDVISDLRAAGSEDDEIDAQDDEIDDVFADDSDEAADLDDQVEEEEAFVPDISVEELPARALYQNSDTLKTRQVIEALDGYRLVSDTTDQIEFLQPDLKRYITLTPNRLLLHCTSMTELETAMTEVEKQCEPEIIYLAKTLVED